ncbi:lysophospholipid transporter LplT [Basilea psittacipulmonis]|uniref:Major facilitator transporter n=1 Tax=Basilea psittacipulmonis DSM 24701 TaxID=1072685 RepID=A0A077DFN4_9BURK|nr:lysophospholipid transporter LplT [Basilea psittacipulmonis]AIL32991.1 major facilitator transporter [Basilea psittacipulmonis DSM 24701]
MKKGFYAVMLAQALSSLADNALFIAAISLINNDLHGPEWMQGAMKWFFAFAYVILAAFVGAIADSFPKGKVMFATNTLKFFGCIMMFAYLLIPSESNTLQAYLVCLCYGIVGIGAAAYSPAKYGIVTEMLPPEDLVKGNSWIEGLTVLSIILGFVTGGVLIEPKTAEIIRSIPFVSHLVTTPGECAVFVIAFIYVAAALCNLMIPNTHYVYPKQSRNPITLTKKFSKFVVALWKDPVGQLSLAVTTLFWGAGACLQLIVIKWGSDYLNYSTSDSSYLMGISAIGIAIGAVLASLVPLKKGFMVMPCGVLMGLITPLMIHITPDHAWEVYALLLSVGILSGFFVVPMNALLQHRGHVLLSAGHSIAVQNFNEQLNILLMVGIYTWMLHAELSISTIIYAFSSCVALIMLLCMIWYWHNKRKYPVAFNEIGDTAHGKAQI